MGAPSMTETWETLQQRTDDIVLLDHVKLTGSFASQRLGAQGALLGQNEKPHLQFSPREETSVEIHVDKVSPLTHIGTNTKPLVPGLQMQRKTSFVSSKMEPYVYEVCAPPGALGLILSSSGDGPTIHRIKDNSPIREVISEGDIIISVNGQDTSVMSAFLLSRFLSQCQAEDERRMIIWRKSARMNFTTLI